jgi:hypothetical protein
LNNPVPKFNLLFSEGLLFGSLVDEMVKKFDNVLQSLSFLNLKDEKMVKMLKAEVQMAEEKVAEKNRANDLNGRL